LTCLPESGAAARAGADAIAGMSAAAAVPKSAERRVRPVMMFPPLLFWLDQIDGFHVTGTNR
jgi:hypothetical protein